MKDNVFQVPDTKQSSDDNINHKYNIDGEISQKTQEMNGASNKPVHNDQTHTSWQHSTPKPIEFGAIELLLQN